MTKASEKLPKKMKLTWLTKCPLCGKTHINLWIFLEDPKKHTYRGCCPKIKEDFEIECF